MKKIIILAIAFGAILTVSANQEADSILGKFDTPVTESPEIFRKKAMEAKDGSSLYEELLAEFTWKWEKGNSVLKYRKAIHTLMNEWNYLSNNQHMWLIEAIRRYAFIAPKTANNLAFITAKVYNINMLSLICWTNKKFGQNVVNLASFLYNIPEYKSASVLLIKRSLSLINLIHIKSVNQIESQQIVLAVAILYGTLNHDYKCVDLSYKALTYIKNEIIRKFEGTEKNLLLTYFMNLDSHVKIKTKMEGIISIFSGKYYPKHNNYEIYANALYNYTAFFRLVSEKKREQFFDLLTSGGGIRLCANKLSSAEFGKLLYDSKSITLSGLVEFLNNQPKPKYKEWAQIILSEILNVIKELHFEKKLSKEFFQHSFDHQHRNVYEHFFATIPTTESHSEHRRIAREIAEERARYLSHRIKTNATRFSGIRATDARKELEFLKMLPKSILPEFD
jgi:hypothetical protein